MSSAITLVGHRQVIPLASRLIVGIRLQGTIAFVDPRNPYSIKARPYLTYFAETLRRLQCDVTLFVPTNAQNDQALMDGFHRRDFPVPFRYVHDHAKFGGIEGTRQGNRSSGVAANNYTEYLRQKAHAVNGTGQATDRVLFLDAEVNYRFTPVQTLILDGYEPLTRRQQRELVKEHLLDPFGMPDSMSTRRARRYAEQASRLTGTTVRHRAAVQQQHLREEMETIQSSTDLLIAEQQQQSQQQQRQNESVSLPVAARDAASTNKRNGTEAGASPSSSTSKAGPSTATAAASGTMSRALAINMEDYSLVALAEMIAEMSASDGAVADYLKTEPLIEKVEVPFHGKAYYLPPENCDNIDLLNWDEIKVMEKAARDTGEEAPVVETAEHRDFFQ